MSTTPGEPVLVGSMTAALHTELGMLMGELAARRTLGDDLAAWFALHPEWSESFGAFQERRAEEHKPVLERPKRRRCG